MPEVRKRSWEYKGKTKTAWVVRYRDSTDTYRQKTFPTKKDADRYSFKVETEIDAGDHVAAGASLKIADLADLYIRSLEQGLRDKTGVRRGAYVQRRHWIETYIVPKLGHVLARDLTKARIDTWATELRKAQDWKPRTARAVLDVLGYILEFGTKRGMVAHNYVREVRAWSEHKPGRRVPVRTFTMDEMRTLFRAIQSNRFRTTDRASAMMRIAIYLAAFCGLRRGEVFGLTWEHLCFDTRTIRVRHSLDQWGELKGPKTAAGIRDVPMPDIVAEVLEGWRRFYVPNDRGLLFLSRTGGVIATGSWHTSWSKVLNDAGLRPDKEGRALHFHALRHFAASMMIDRGIPLPEAASLLGHATFDMTLQVYAHKIVRSGGRHSALEGTVNAVLAIK